LIFKGEYGEPFQVLSHQVLTGVLTLEFTSPSRQVITKAAQIGATTVQYKGTDYPADQQAFYVVEANDFNESGSWSVRIIQTLTAPDKVKKSHRISFSVKL